MSGLRPERVAEKIYIGSVSEPATEMNEAMMVLSRLKVKARSAAAITAGAISGRVI